MIIHFNTLGEFLMQAGLDRKHAKELKCLEREK